MATRMQQRRGTAAEWAAQNPILADGEIGFERDTKVLKMGDGTTPWSGLGLPYLPTGGGQLTGILDMNGNRIDNIGPMATNLDMGDNSIEHLGPMTDELNMNGNVIQNLGAMPQALNMGNNRVTNVGTPTGSNDAVNRAYMDGLMPRLKWWGTLAADFTGLQGNKTQWMASDLVTIPANHTVKIEVTFTVRIGVGSTFTINHFVQRSTTELFGVQQNGVRPFIDNEKFPVHIQALWTNGASQTSTTFNVRTGSDISSNPFRILGGNPIGAIMSVVDLGVIG